MAIEVFNRFEKKYILDEHTFTRIINELGDYMEMDEYNKGQEFYNIANIYYDTPTNDLIARSLEKPDYKEKLRLRSYGVPELDDKVFLEIKKKFDGMVNKRRTKLRLGEAYDFIEKGIVPAESTYINKQVLNELQYFLSVYDLYPKVYLTYDRKAFFAVDDSDFRITFDTNIRSRREDVRLEAGNYGEFLMDNSLWLMEIKSSKAIPLWFTHLLSEEKLYPASFSKYGTEYKKYITNLINKGEESICWKKYSETKQLHQYHPGKQYYA